ncbi:MAG TPA: SpoIIE family protein phosphatase, partial [Verrucomicrobiae bacterium]|nr:SpoIIE family protein phosphatase [Verrucomicrobiae bacterium]
LFLVAWYAEKKQAEGKSIVVNPFVYALSIGIYATSWTFYGSVGKAATTGIDFLLIYLGPSLTAFTWWFVLRKAVRITRENNITSIADFISSRYGKSQVLGALVTLIAVIGIMPYIALQLKAVATTFKLLCGETHIEMAFPGGNLLADTGFLAAIVLGTFSVFFGARRLVSSERHEGLVAAIALESVVKLLAFLSVGIFVTFFLFDGFGDIFTKMQATYPELMVRLTTFGSSGENSYTAVAAILFISMGAVLLLPRQFHIMIIENSDEKHIKEAMWLFPTYLFLINIFVIPIAFGGIVYTGSNGGADSFVLSLPLQSGHRWLALFAFLGGFSAAAGMVMVESVAISTMVLDHLLMPVLVRLKPQAWFPGLLINLKRLGIFIVVLLGYVYYHLVADTVMLVNMGIISFVAAAQFAPSFLGALYWRRGNRIGAITGMGLGFTIWFYTLLLPTIINAGRLDNGLLQNGLFGIPLLRPTALFGLEGFDTTSHALFWSMLFNIAGYAACSIVLGHDERDKEQAGKFVDIFKSVPGEVPWEKKRLSKPITILQFVNLMSKFVGQVQAEAAISEYLGGRNIDEHGRVSEFELPSLKRFIERTLAGSVGAAAAGAIVESYLSDIGSKMESFYDAFSTVRSSLAESREALYVRLRASEIMNRTLDLQIIIDDLLSLIVKEFKLDLVVVRLLDAQGALVVRGHKGNDIPALLEDQGADEHDPAIAAALKVNKPQFANDVGNHPYMSTRLLLEASGIKSFAQIPIAREGEPPIGILSAYSRSITGLFTEPFLQLLSSLAGQLAQAATIVTEMEAREKERQEKEQALLENMKVVRDMEIAKQIQMSLLPSALPQVRGVSLAGRCIPAAHVGGDYYDVFTRGPDIVEIAIADVSGHSVGAALIMAETRSVLRAQVYGAARASEILQRLNELLYEDLSHAELFITMFYVKYNSSSGRLSFANGGHNRPVLVRGDGTRVELDADGLILGVKKRVIFEEKSLEMHSGDVLVLYTDGIVEAQNREGEFFGNDRLAQAAW